MGSRYASETLCPKADDILIRIIVRAANHPFSTPETTLKIRQVMAEADSFQLLPDVQLTEPKLLASTREKVRILAVQFLGGFRRQDRAVFTTAQPTYNLGNKGGAILRSFDRKFGGEWSHILSETSKTIEFKSSGFGSRAEVVSSRRPRIV